MHANHPQADPARVLLKAFLNAGEALGLSREELGQVVGRNRSSFARGGLTPQSKAGELALLLIRCYRSLYALMGGETAPMRHWMHTPNLHTGGVPAEQVRSITGLAEVCAYLDGMRGRN